MAKGKHYREQLMMYLLGELSKEEAEEVKAHLALCPECGEKLKQYEKIFQLMNLRAQIEPPSAFWKNYWKRLRPKLKERKLSRWQLFSLRPGLQSYPRWSLILATSAMIFLIGIGLYWFFSAGKSAKPFEAELPIISQQEQYIMPGAYIKRAAGDYLEEVKPVLLEMANSQPEIEGERIDFSLEKELSQQLLLQNRLLRRAAVRSFDPQLQSLLEDIEIALMDISNIEEKRGKPSIDIIKQNASGLSIKIDLFTSKLKINMP